MAVVVSCSGLLPLSSLATLVLLLLSVATGASTLNLFLRTFGVSESVFVSLALTALRASRTPLGKEDEQGDRLAPTWLLSKSSAPLALGKGWEGVPPA